MLNFVATEPLLSVLASMYGTRTLWCGSLEVSLEPEDTCETRMLMRQHLHRDAPKGPACPIGLVCPVQLLEERHVLSKE